jgi:hypothetical protein
VKGRGTGLGLGFGEKERENLDRGWVREKARREGGKGIMAG